MYRIFGFCQKKKGGDYNNDIKTIFTIIYGDARTSEAWNIFKQMQTLST